MNHNLIQSVRFNNDQLIKYRKHYKVYIKITIAKTRETKRKELCKSDKRCRAITAYAYTLREFGLSSSNVCSLGRMSDFSNASVGGEESAESATRRRHRNHEQHIIWQYQSLY